MSTFDTRIQRPHQVLFRDFAVLEHELAGLAAAHAQLVELLRDREIP